MSSHVSMSNPNPESHSRQIWTFLRLMSSHVSMSNPNPESHSRQIWAFLRLMSSHVSMSNPNPESHPRYIISRFHLNCVQPIQVLMYMMDGWERSFSFHKVETLLVLSFLPGGGGVLVLAGNTRIYSPGRLWLPIFRAGWVLASYLDMNLRSARNFDLRLDMICGLHRPVRGKVVLQSI